jgi:sorbitol-specific phosphotransferase system component IIC
MFRPNWPSSGVQVKDSAAHCNAGFFPHIVVASGYFVYVGYHQFRQLQQEERNPHYSGQLGRNM